MRHYLVGDVAYPESNETAVEHGRPVVVLDPDDAEQIERLLSSLTRMSFAAHACGARTCLRSALRELIHPPKPAEPTGLGAVVKDADGETWVRNQAGEWINLHSRYGIDPAHSWADLCAKYGPIEVQS